MSALNKEALPAFAEAREDRGSLESRPFCFSGNTLCYIGRQPYI